MANQRGFAWFVTLVAVGFVVSVGAFAFILLKKKETPAAYIQQQVSATPLQESAATAVENGPLEKEVDKIKVDNVDGDFQQIDNDVKSLGN